MNNQPESTKAAATPATVAGEVYGYARVSTTDQNEDRQLISFRAYNIKRENIFIDRQSGKDYDRPGYKSLLSRLRKGDVLVVSSVDRLGRNFEETLLQWRILRIDIGVEIRFLDDDILPSLPTDSKAASLIRELILALMAYTADAERQNIRTRQAQGIAAAKLRGVRFGRPETPTPPNFHPVAELVRSGRISIAEGARRLGLSYSTFRKKLKG